MLRRCTYESGLAKKLSTFHHTLMFLLESFLYIQFITCCISLKHKELMTENLLSQLGICQITIPISCSHNKRLSLNQNAICADLASYPSFSILRITFSNSLYDFSVCKCQSDFKEMGKGQPLISVSLAKQVGNCHSCS